MGKGSKQIKQLSEGLITHLKTQKHLPRTEGDINYVDVHYSYQDNEVINRTIKKLLGMGYDSQYDGDNNTGGHTLTIRKLTKQQMKELLKK